MFYQELSAKINRSIEQQVAASASSGKLTIMKNIAMEGSVLISGSFTSKLPDARTSQYYRKVC